MVFQLFHRIFIVVKERNEMKKTETKILEGYYHLAKAAFNWTSFDPEKRARQTIDSYSEQLEADLIIVAKYEEDVERYKAGYIKKFTAWLGAKSRCMSSMITGPANFPTRRAEKANNAEHNKYGEFDGWRDKVLGKIQRPENTDIVKGSDGAIEKMEAKLKTLEERQEFMKSVNKIARKKYDDEDRRILDLMELGLTAKTVDELLNPSQSYYGKGFQGFYLTNNGATIRNLKKSIHAETNRLDKYSKGNKEYTLGDVNIIENVDDNRLQLFFDGKPEDEVRRTLKKNGYRWSPRNECWQRQLTENALYCLRFLDFLPQAS